LQKARRELEAGVLLADDEHAASGIGLGRTRLGVVQRFVDARDLGAPRLGHADGEDRHLAAILTVARLEDPAITLATRPGPATAVAHRDARAIGEGGEVPLHFLARWVIRTAVHHRAHQGAAAFLFG